MSANVQSDAFDCRLCGNAFIALAHLRSHQTNLCSTVVNVIPDVTPEEEDAHTELGPVEVIGTGVAMETTNPNELVVEVAEEPT